MRDRNIQIQISLQTIVGCYDLVHQYGLGSAGRDPQEVVGIILEALIKAMTREGRLPSYAGERQLQTILAQYVVEENQSGIPLSGAIKPQPGFPVDPSAEVAGRSEEDSRDSPPLLPSFKEKAQEIAEEIEEAKLSSLFQTSSDAVSLTESELEEPEVLLDPETLWASIPEGDILKQECNKSGGTERMTAIVLVYREIPRELWGSEKARAMVDMAERALAKPPEISTQP